MNSIAKIYKSKFKESLSPYGFRLYRKTFYRVVNDVVQVLMLRNQDTDYTIDFAIWPLCLGVSDLYCEGQGIDEFRKSGFQNENYKYWEIKSPLTDQRHSTRILEKYVDEMLAIVISHVMPVFEKINSWDLWFDDLDKKGVRHGYLSYVKAGDFEKAISSINVIIQENLSAHKNYDVGKYERSNYIKAMEKELSRFKLKYELVTSANYSQTRAEILSRNDVDPEIKKLLLCDDAIKHYETTSYLKLHISHYTRDLTKIMNPNSQFSKEIETLYLSGIESTNSMRERISEYKKIIELLSIPDINFFDNILSKNEAKALEYLDNPRQYKQKHGY